MKSTAAIRMATIACLMTGALSAQAAPADSLWSRLWRTPDQRGQALLQQGDAARAAQTFVDPQHKGHAALQAHDYNSAAKTLAGVDTAEAQYNRGNALAHTGDLQGAISAYEAALKHNPQHTDARHNRDVVAAALKKQQDAKKDSGKQDTQENQKKDKKDSKDNKAGDKPNDSNGGKDDKDGKDGKPGDPTSNKPNGTPGQKPAEAPRKQPASAAQPGQATPPAAPASNPKNDAEQARRDAESSLGKGVQQPTAQPQIGASAPTPGTAGAMGQALQPPTEKQIAQEQWLRAIPDDPGGLLRRKFLIEHMLRQQGQKP